MMPINTKALLCSKWPRWSLAGVAVILTVTFMAMGKFTVNNGNRMMTIPQTSLRKDDGDSDPSSLLKRGIQGEFVETIGSDGNHTYRFKSNHSEQTPDYIGALRRYARNETTTGDDDMNLLERLRGKRILLMGDSTDQNVYYAINSFPSKKNKALGKIGPPIAESSRRECHGDRKHMMSCVWPSLSLSIQWLGIQYGIHPYGSIPNREVGPMGSCDGDLKLKECLLLKWNHTTNGIDSLKEMHYGVVDQPDIVTIDINLWFWFRLKYFHKQDPVDFFELDNDSQMREYKKNVTEFFEAFQQYLPNVPTWAITTSLMTTEESRIPSNMIALTNPTIRNFALSNDKNIRPVLVDWDAMTSDLPRDEILDDGLHGKYFFNRAIGNVYLNALAASDSSRVEEKEELSKKI